MAQWKFSGANHKYLQVYTERIFRTDTECFSLISKCLQKEIYQFKSWKNINENGNTKDKREE